MSNEARYNSHAQIETHNSAYQNIFNFYANDIQADIVVVVFFCFYSIYTRAKKTETEIMKNGSYCFKA